MKENLYYIQHGYVGNAMCWWRKGDKGYSTNLSEAGIYSEAVAKRQTAMRPSEDTAWLCNYIDGNEKAHKIVIDSQYCDFSKMIFIKKKKRKALGTGDYCICNTGGSKYSCPIHGLR